LAFEHAFEFGAEGGVGRFGLAAGGQRLDLGGQGIDGALQQSAELMYRTARLNAGDRAYRHLAKPQQREAAALTAAARVLATGEAL
jgi:hypothetical protein